MGAWGAGTFENDTACDWVYFLEESNDLSIVELTLEKVLAAGSEYLEAPDAEEALAAAEVVARLKGNPGEKNSFTESIDAWVTKSNLKVPPDLANKAVAAIERILAEPSEIVELWKESEEFDVWHSNVNNLKSRIHS